MPESKIGSYRWSIVALLFFATTINYVDRQVISLLKPVLEKNFSWSETGYSHIVMAFSIAYAIGLLSFGKIVDSIGTKLGYSISVVIWSIAAMLHAFAKTTFGFGIARAALGLGESGNFPAAIKTTAEWFPKKERAFATGILNSGTSIGAVIAALGVPLLQASFGWQYAFIITGSFGFVWLIFWMVFYKIPAHQKKLSKKEFDFIHSDHDESRTFGIAGAEKKIPWLKLFGIRQTWAFVFGKMLTDPVWWFMLFWLPSYFSSTFQLNLSKPGWPLAIIYSATTIGSVGGGYLSSYLIKKGMNVYKARKKVMFIYACCVLPLVTAQFITNMWLAVALISLAAAAHQAWSANIYTTASDFFPKNAVSSIIGIGGMAGAVGGILFPLLVGLVLEHFKLLGNITAGYNILFIICSVAYLIAWIIMHLLTRNARQVMDA